MAAGASDALQLSGRNLTEIPEEALLQCDTIAILDLSRNPGIRLHGTLHRFKNVRKLVLTGCALREIPDDILELTQLEDLDLGLNQFSDGHIPPAIGQLHGLKKLNLESCDLRTLPDWLGDLEALEDLDLGFNQFSDGHVPPAIGLLHGLKKLNLPCCDLRTLPDWLGDLEALEELDLACNEFSEEPNESLGRLHRVKKLDLSSCHLQTVPDWLGELKALEDLDLGCNQFSDVHVPPAIGQLHRLKKLNLKRCDLRTLPDWLGDLEALEELDLSWNDFSEGPNASLGRLHRIKKLDLCSCRLQTVPDWLGELEALEDLDLQLNKEIRRLNPKMVRLSQLKKLQLKSCSLTSVPHWLGDLKMLTDLNLSNNQLQDYPECTLRLKNLQILDLSDDNTFLGNEVYEGNSIKLLPVDLAYTTLRELKLLGNPIADVPVAIWERGIYSIRSYMRSIIHRETLMYADTINMVGDTFAGKTSVSQSLILNFPSAAFEEDRTRVMQQLRFTPDLNAGLSVNINDFGGHYIYHSVLPCDGLSIIVYDMSDKTQNQESTITKWLFTVLAKSGNVRVILVGTRSDKLSSEERASSEQHIKCFTRKILRLAIEEVKSYVNRQKCALFDASGNDHLRNVEELLFKLEHVKISVVTLSCTVEDKGLAALKDCVVDSLRPPERLPVKWYLVIKDIQTAFPECLYLRFDHVLAIATGRLTDDEDSNFLVVVLRYLVTTSQIFWFEDHPFLQQFIFHSPQRLIDVCKKILDHDQALQLATEWAPCYEESITLYKKGILQESLLMKLLAGDDENRRVVVEFLQQFKLISQFASNNEGRVFIIPSSLRSEAPSRVQEWEQEAKQCFGTISVRLAFIGLLIPLAFFETSIVSILKVANTFDKEEVLTDVWRDGVTIRHDEVKFTARRDAGAITLMAFSARNQVSPWSILHPVLRGLNDNVNTSWHGIPPECTVVCPACRWCNRGSSTTGLINARLQSLAAEPTTRTSKIVCPQCDRSVPRVLCYPTSRGSFTSEEQGEIAEFLKELDQKEPAAAANLTKKFQLARPRLVNELDRISIDHIVDELMAALDGVGLITDKQRQLIKAEPTDFDKARLLHDVVGKRGDDAIKVMATALTTKYVNRPDLAALLA